MCSQKTYFMGEPPAAGHISGDVVAAGSAARIGRMGEHYARDASAAASRSMWGTEGEGTHYHYDMKLLAGIRFGSWIVTLIVFESFPHLARRPLKVLHVPPLR